MIYTDGLKNDVTEDVGLQEKLLLTVEALHLAACTSWPMHVSLVIRTQVASSSVQVPCRLSLLHLASGISRFVLSVLLLSFSCSRPPDACALFNSFFGVHCLSQIHPSLCGLHI